MGIVFVVEAAVHIAGRGVVFARPVVETADFRVTPGSTLDGIPVKPHIDLPRRPRPDGSIDLQYFQFELVDSADLNRIRRGPEVLLELGNERKSVVPTA